MKEVTVWLCEYLADMDYHAVISNGEVVLFVKERSQDEQ